MKDRDTQIMQVIFDAELIARAKAEAGSCASSWGREDRLEHLRSQALGTELRTST